MSANLTQNTLSAPPLKGGNIVNNLMWGASQNKLAKKIMLRLLSDRRLSDSPTMTTFVRPKAEKRHLSDPRMKSDVCPTRSLSDVNKNVRPSVHPRRSHKTPGTKKKFGCANFNYQNCLLRPCPPPSPYVCLSKSGWKKTTRRKKNCFIISGTTKIKR